MKKTVSLLACLFLGFGQCFAEGNITFKEVSYDFGKISASGGPVTHVFEFTNNHSTPLVVTNVKASCGCTTPSYTKEPIETGKSGEITVTFNPAGYNSNFHKSVTVSTNHEPNVQLQISGTVIGEPVKRDTTAEYPIGFGIYRVKKQEINFGTIAPKETKSVRLEVFNNSDKPISQQAAKIPKYLNVTFGEEPLGAKKESTVNITFSAANAGYGHIKGNLELIIDGKTQQFPYTATVADKVSDLTPEKKKAAGKINFSVNEIRFESLKKSNSQTLKISNSGQSTLTVHKIQSGDSRITLSKTAFSIKPGEIVSVVITADKKIKEAIATNISIFSDAPNKPVAEIQITGNP
ncbi:MAG: DUF1573 domain-containing protein [Dysgonamonadaceae bacterium]|jgi:uncharacterized cupredoxin-like copper-binding protein|nr:DUF1573 domain-containing protein [Dysgonamonadaceae bacterium]